ncbi:MAG: hypothetical protein JXA52_10345, partial [Planctomycetes bacterium]|nr:hypothetical protein [Planctomycetota bacterium]
SLFPPDCDNMKDNISYIFMAEIFSHEVFHREYHIGSIHLFNDYASDVGNIAKDEMERLDRTKINLRYYNSITDHEYIKTVSQLDIYAAECGDPGAVTRIKGEASYILLQDK